MFGIFGDDPFQQRTRLRGPFEAQQALAKMRASINVLWIPLHRSTITALGLFQLSFLKMKIAKLGIVMRLIKIMDLGFELFHAAFVESAWQFEAAGRGGSAAINPKV